MISFDPHKLIRQLLPTFLRTPVRVAWLEALLSPFTALWTAYVDWRAVKVYEAHVTSQTISMEAYLNRLFDPAQRRIRIAHSMAKHVYVSLIRDTYDSYIPGDDGAFVDKDGENYVEVTGFLVLIPHSVDALQVEGTVRQIKAAGVPFSVEATGEAPFVEIDKSTIWLSTANETADTQVLSNTEWKIK